MQASEEAIHRLQEEEQRLVRSLEYQALQDEELARKMVAEEKEQVINLHQFTPLPSLSLVYFLFFSFPLVQGCHRPANG